MASVKQKILQAKRKETIDKPKKNTVKEEVKENETYIEKSIRIECLFKIKFEYQFYKSNYLIQVRISIL